MSSIETFDAGVSQAPLAVSGTHSGRSFDPDARLRVLMREGLLATIIMFAVSAAANVALGTSTPVRIAIASAALLIALVGIMACKKMGGQLFVVFAYVVIIENHFIFQLSALRPSLFLVLLVLMMRKNQRHETVLLTESAGSLQGWVALLLYAVLTGMIIAVTANPRWFWYSVNGLLRQSVTALLFAMAGAWVMRKGSAGLFLNLLVFLATIAAFTTWFYQFTGREILYSVDTTGEDLERYGGFFKNPNNSSFFCALAILISLARLRSASYSLKLFFILNSLFLLATMIHVRTRGALVVMAVLMPFVLIHRGLRKWIIVLAVVAPLTLAFFSEEILSARGGGDVQSLGDRMKTLRQDADLRMAIYADTLQATLRYPLGSGQVGGVLSLIEPTHGYESHNDYLTMLFQNGYQTFISLLALFLLLSVCWLRAIRRKLPHRPGLELGAAVACYWLTFNFEPVYSNVTQLAVLFGLLWGMVYASLAYAPPRPAESPAFEEQPQAIEEAVQSQCQ